MMTLTTERSRQRMISMSSLLLLVVLMGVCRTHAFATLQPAAFVPFSSSSSRASSALSMAQQRGRPKGPLRTIEQKPTMNNEIASNELRVTTSNPNGGKDEALGIMSKGEALAKAKEMGGLDLILINENSDPPVCKIADYSKWRYEKEKKAKELKKNAKATEIKEVKMSYKIDVHDYDVRKKNASKFINQGNRVKCTVMFRGREVQHDKLGFELLDRLAADLEDLCQREGKAKREGRNLSLILSPKPDVLKRINELKRAEEKAKKKKKDNSKIVQEMATAGAGVTGAAGAIAAQAEEALSQLDEEDVGTDGLLDSINLDQDDDGDEGNLSASLDDLLGSDDLTDELFG